MRKADEWFMILEFRRVVRGAIDSSEQNTKN